VNESSQTGASSCASEQGPGSSGRPSAETLCRWVIDILDAGHTDQVTVGLLRAIFDIPERDNLPPVIKRPWPPLRAADPHDPRD
jgi:hypothetical protein